MSSLLAISRGPCLAFDGSRITSLLGPAVSLGVSQLGKQHAMMYKSASLGFAPPEPPLLRSLSVSDTEMSLIGSLVTISRRSLQQNPRIHQD